MKTCWKCGKNGLGDPLDRHHIFDGSYRKTSEEYGLVVYLCHSDCHIFGPMSVHRNRDEMLRLKRWGQRQAMEENGWTTEDFVLRFGKNYL